MSTDEGYFLMARGFLDHPRFQPRGAFTPAEVMIWLIREAAFAPRVKAITVGTERRAVHLQRGQMACSIRFLATAWRWSPNRVQRFLDDLKDEGTVDTQTDTGITIITLCNYERYQKPFSDVDTQSNTQSNTQSDTNKKEGKELKENMLSAEGFEGKKQKLSAEGFDLFWKHYPLRVAKQAAEKAYAKVIASGRISESDLLAKTKAFAATWAARPTEDRKYIKHPATWLNGGCYDDEAEATANQAATLPPVVSPSKLTDADWRSFLKLLTDKNQWPESYLGPRPGMPGCIVPSHLLIAPVPPEGSLRAAVATPLRRNTPGGP
jgi:DNA-binding transcriptional regulator YhcF (GntR family)